MISIQEVFLEYLINLEAILIFPDYLEKNNRNYSIYLVIYPGNNYFNYIDYLYYIDYFSSKWVGSWFCQIYFKLIEIGFECWLTCCLDVLQHSVQTAWQCVLHCHEAAQRRAEPGRPQSGSSFGAFYQR